jgi:hypothetical protein
MNSAWPNSGISEMIRMSQGTRTADDLNAMAAVGDHPSSGGRVAAG